ncbi:A-kinase anchor protein 10, mitochondrial-like [Mytilus trossulus]|uniref:A-kinase anchor protein 10, mitochondrial-like n=1 Tax=Mytilus trossulus TaxID=6551 RepID=UPI0030054D4B
MPLFRRKTDKSKLPPEIKQSGSLKRTPSNRSKDLSNGTVSPGKILPDDELSKDENFESLHKKSSQLCKTLQEILHDKNSLGHFIQFLEDRKASKFLRFWLDAQSFQASTWSRIRSLAFKKRQSSSEKEKCDSVCNQEVSTQKSQNSGLSDDQQIDGYSECDTSKSRHVESDANSISVIKPSAKDLKGEVTENFSPSGESLTNSEGEVIQNVPPSCQTLIKSKPLTDSAYEDNKKCPESPNSDVFEPIIKDSSIKSHSSKYSSPNLTDKLKKSIENDAVQIFSKYLSKEATDPLGVDDVLRQECISKICREDGEVDPDCFVVCQEFSVSKIESEHFPSYNGSEFHLRYQIDLVTSGHIYLSDFLYYDPAFFYFMEYMEQEGGSNILQFWIAVENFEKHLRSHESGYDGMQAQADAMVLYDKYFSLQATHPLGFDDKCRFDVECNICREEGPLPDCFSKPREMVLKTIEKVYFSDFRQSEIFYKFLSELVGTVHSTRELPRQRKRTDSDASQDSSTHSGESVRSSTRNTLLASGTSLPLGRAMRKFENDMNNIDPSLLNPDLLWKRDNPKMVMGTVDGFGQFKSEFDPHPDKDKEKPKGTGFFRKSKEKEKEEEEMAIKIAQMIISDVTSVTQTIGAMKSQSFSDKPES